MKLSDIFWPSKKESNVAQVPTPQFFEDPTYRSSQDFLQKYGTDILGGNIPSYYSSIGQANSPEFQGMLNLSNRDIANSAAESAALTGRGRGGSLPQVTAQAIGDNSSKLRFADFMNANAGKQFLMGAGTGITEGVRNSGQAQGASKNAFNTSIYGAALDRAKYQDQWSKEFEAKQGEALGRDIGIATSIFGGAAGAGAGGAGFGGIMAGGAQGGFQGMFDPSHSGTQSFLDNIFKSSPQSAPASNYGTEGVSNLGAIKMQGIDPQMLMSLFGGL